MKDKESSSEEKEVLLSAMISPYLIFFYQNKVVVRSCSGYIPSIPKINLILKSLEKIKKKGSKYINDYNEEVERQMERDLLRKDEGIEGQRKNPCYGYIYLIECGDLHKIGITKNNPKKRLKAYRTANPFDTKILFCKRISNYKKIEKKIKTDFQNKLKKGKEWFNFSKKDIDKIVNYLERGVLI